jgi:hypothetical protein
MKVRLKPSAWADTWEGKATAPELVGVRLVAEADLARARGEAERTAAKLHPRLDERSAVWVQAYDQALMHFVIACALCLHDDVSEPLFEMQEFVISHRLSSAGTLRLWDAYEELRIVDSPLSPEIGEEGAAALAAVITQDAWWDALPKQRRAQVGRLLQRVAEIASEAQG